MKIIYRIEHYDGLGFYNQYDNIKKCSRESYNRKYSNNKFIIDLLNRHADFPNARTEGLDIYKYNENWYHAFNSIDILFEWIKKEELEILYKFGYKVYKIEIEEHNCQSGELQSIYLKQFIVTKEDITLKILDMKHHWYDISIKKIWRNIFIFLVFSIILSIFIENCRTNRTSCSTFYNINTIDSSKTKIKQLEELIKKYNIHDEKLVLAQAILESNPKLSSELAVKYNNYFGMNICGLERKTTAIGICYQNTVVYSKNRKVILDLYNLHGGWAIYSCMDSCVQDYKYFQEYVDHKSFVNYIKNNYSQDGTYYDKLKQISKTKNQ